MRWPEETGKVIATRRYELVESPRGKVTLKICQPMRSEKADDYYASFVIEGNGGVEVEHIFGVDGIQALRLALEAVPGFLEAWQKRHRREIRWTGGREGEQKLWF